MPEDQRVPQSSDGEAASLKNVSLPSLIKSDGICGFSFLIPGLINPLEY